MLFSKRDPVTKLSLLKAYCSTFYGSVVWDLLHSSTLMLFVLSGARVLDASGTSHITLTVHYCYCCVDYCCSWMNLRVVVLSLSVVVCIHIESDVDQFVARHGVYFTKMLSPVGRNSFCC